MLRKAWDALRFWTEGKKKRRAYKSAPIIKHRTRLSIEPLERREVPANLL
jgi:hypothetical protein